MKWGSLFGWGIAIYAVMYLFWNGLVLYGFVSGLAPRVLSIAVLIAVTGIAARSLRYASAKDIAPYSIAWAIIAGLLDIIFTVPYAGWAMFSDWNIWVGYALVATIPVLTPYVHRSREQY